MTNHDLEALARAMRYAAHAVYVSTLDSRATGQVRSLRDKMHVIQVGKVVAELSTVYRDSSHIRAVGILTKVVKEPIDEEYDVVLNGGEPVPLELIHYIQTFGGEIVRWKNCRFVALPEVAI